MKYTKYLCWIKGAFHPYTIEALTKAGAKARCKEISGRVPYHIEKQNIETVEPLGKFND